MVLVPLQYGKINMVVLSIIYVLQTYHYFLYYRNPIIYLLTVVSVHNDMAERLLMA